LITINSIENGLVLVFSFPSSTLIDKLMVNITAVKVANNILKSDINEAILVFNELNLENNRKSVLIQF
jgi:hypothetical protein